MTVQLPRSIWEQLRALFDGLTEPFRLAGVNRKVQAQRDKIEALSDAQLIPYLDSEWSRAKDLDDKLQKLTAALSVAVTVGGLVATTILQDLNAGPAKYFTAVLFLIAALYLLGGVWLGFNGLRPKPRWGYGVAFITIAEGKNKVAARQKRIEAVANFERDNLIRSNEASAATSAIRNGVLFFGAALVFGVAAASLGESKAVASMSGAGSNLIVQIDAKTGKRPDRDEDCTGPKAPTAFRAPTIRREPPGEVPGGAKAEPGEREQKNDQVSCIAQVPVEQFPAPRNEDRRDVSAKP